MAEPAQFPGGDAVITIDGVQTIARLRGDLEQRLASYRSPHALDAAAKNQLLGRYVIKPDLPLPEYARGEMHCYAVADLMGNLLPLYAAVCDSGLPYRHTSMEKLRSFENEHLVRVEGHGISFITSLGEERHVILFEKPKGKKLSIALAEGSGMGEQKITEQLLSPLATILSQFEEMGISHCHIHPSNLYFGEHILLGESISTPAGYAQEFLYEPVERIPAIPHGKGGGSIKVDIYALGVLVVDILKGLGRLRGLTREQLTNLLLTQGSYNVIAGNNDFSEHYQDLLRGTLSDAPEDRWGPPQLKQWLTGKRYNIIHPSAPRDTSRAYAFEGQDYFSRKALAHSMFTQWEKARNWVRTSKLDRWLEQGIQEPETADLFTAAVHITGGSNNNSVKRNAELLSRTICIIDPSGPLRADHLAFNIDALGKMLSETLYHKRQSDLNVLVELIGNDLPHFWSERQQGRVTKEMQEALWKLQNVRASMTNQAFGFGIERCLYDLNTELPCYSSVLKGFYVTDLGAMVRALDAIAPANPAQFTVVDRHMAAFIASKLPLGREVRFAEFTDLAPELAANQELKILSLVSRAQEKSGERDLKGLSGYVAVRLLMMLEHVHSRKIRDSLAQKIRHASEEGRVKSVMDALLDHKTLERDHKGFERARELFHRNAAETTRLNDRDLQKKQTTAKGRQWACFIAVIILLVTGFVVGADLLL